MRAPAPIVSVVIPCFNQAHFLHAAIDSVRVQAYPSIELIVVDDGSTDGTTAVAEARGVLVVRQANGGLGSARNAGLRAATGEFIVFLDADDELMPDAIASGVATLRRHRRAACVAARCQLIDREGRPMATSHPVLATADLYREWLWRNFVWTPGAVVFRRQALRAMGGFPEDVGPAADYAVYLALARAGRVRYERRNAVRYRQHDANMSRDPVRMLRATLTVLRRERRHVPPRHAADYRGGLRAWRLFYGEQIAEWLRVEWRSRGIGRAEVAAAAWLAWECPEVVRRHAACKLRRMLRGLPPAPIEPGRFAPLVREPGDAA
jgi:glycosyltransferase involved in cell wall biosynthesis